MVIKIEYILYYHTHMKKDRMVPNQANKKVDQVCLLDFTLEMTNTVFLIKKNVHSIIMGSWPVRNI